MKKIIALLLAVVICFSLVACAQAETNSNEAQEKNTQNTQQEDTQQEDTQQNEAEPQEDTIEITLDNWQDYMEIKDCFSFAYLENQFGEPEKPLPYFCVALTLKEEYRSYLCYDFAVEYNADCCPKDIVYNYEDFTFEIKEREAATQLDESKFVRNGGSMGYMSGLSLHTDSIVDNKVEKEYTKIDAYEIYGYTDPPMSYGFVDNGDSTARVNYYPVNIEITRIQGTFKKN